MKDGKLTIQERADRFDIVFDGNKLGLLDHQTSQVYGISSDSEVSLPEQRRLAMDAALKEEAPNMPTSLKPNNGSNFAGEIRKRFGADQGNMDPDTLLHFVQLCLAGLDGPDRAEFVGRLQALVEAENGASDARRRSGRRPAQDAALRQLNNKSFQDRWPMMRNVRTSGY